MIPSWTYRPIMACLGLSATLCLALSGCGGKGPEEDTAVVVTEPGVNVSTAGTAPAPAAPSTATAPETGTTAPSTPATPVKAEGWGTLKGQVTFSGNPPAQKTLVEAGKAPKDPNVCAKDQPIQSERLIVDAGTKGVKNVLVYIPKPTAINEEAKSAAQQAKVEFDQEHCVFEPHVVVVMTGAEIDLKNSDPVNHNINPKTRANGSNQLLAQGQMIPLKTQAPERTPGSVTCDIHPWMQAYWMVVDSPYFAVTDEKGNYEIKDVPAGTQKVVVWQEAVEKGGFVTPGSGVDVNVKPNDTTTKDFTIDAGHIRPE